MVGDYGSMSTSPDRKPTVPITARTRAEYEEKIKAALKAEYSVGSVVDVQKFADEHQVRTSNVRKVIDAMQTEYPLSLPAPPEHVEIKGEK